MDLIRQLRAGGTEFEHMIWKTDSDWRVLSGDGVLSTSPSAAVSNAISAFEGTTASAPLSSNISSSDRGFLLDVSRIGIE